MIEYSVLTVLPSSKSGINSVVSRLVWNAGAEPANHCRQGTGRCSWHYV